MDSGEVLIAIHGLGLSLVTRADGTVALRPPPGFDRGGELRALLPHLRAHRAAVLARCSTECEVCGHGIHTGDADAVTACCDRGDCPWRAG